MRASSLASSSGMASISSASRAISRSNSSRWEVTEMYSPAPIENAPASSPATPASRISRRSGVAPVPALAAHDPARPGRRRGQPGQDPGVDALVGGHGHGGVGDAVVVAGVGELGPLHDRQHRPGPEPAGQPGHQPHPGPAAVLVGPWRRLPQLDQLGRPVGGMALLGLGQLEEDLALLAVGALGQGPVHGRAVQLVGPVLAELPRLRRQPSPPSLLQCWTGRALPANRKALASPGPYPSARSSRTPAARRASRARSPSSGRTLTARVASVRTTTSCPAARASSAVAWTQ